MCMHETKNCPRCSKKFECRTGTITQCQCYGIALTIEQSVYIEQRYTDCLCRDCLQYMQQELNFFKEKYLFR